MLRVGWLIDPDFFGEELELHASDAEPPAFRFSFLRCHPTPSAVSLVSERIRPARDTDGAFRADCFRFGLELRLKENGCPERAAAGIPQDGG